MYLRVLEGLLALALTHAVWLADWVGRSSRTLRREWKGAQLRAPGAPGGGPRLLPSASPVPPRLPGSCQPWPAGISGVGIAHLHWLTDATAAASLCFQSDWFARVASNSSWHPGIAKQLPPQLQVTQRWPWSECTCDFFISTAPGSSD
jgi:hypothetical protein